MIRGVVGALIGGAVGAAIWAAIAYLAHVEIGWIAIFVGVLSGAGFKFASGGEAEGFMAGVVAAAIALGSIAAGKYAAVTLAVDDFIGGQAEPFTMDNARIYMADALVAEYEQNGKKLAWPVGYDVDSATEQAHYPADLWKDMDTRWATMSPDQQEAYRAACEGDWQANASAFRGEITDEVFVESFNYFDILFGVLAVASAYGLASGASGDE